MKAAVINGFGEIPQYREFPDPVPGNNGVLVKVKASILENLDKYMVQGTHYSSRQLFPEFPAIPGMSGVGTISDGKLVAFRNIKPPYGAFAEKVIAEYTMPIPDGIDAVQATAIPPSVLTALLPLKYAAKLQPGETVLINGGTGVSGRIAIQVAKMLGAGKIIGTGRNERSLKLLSQLGADKTISLEQTEEELSKAFVKAGGPDGYDVIIDFLWGPSAETLIQTLIPHEVGFAKSRIRYIPIGEKSGPAISIPASAFRTSGLEMMGVGKIAQEVLNKEIRQIWEGIKEEQYFMEIEKVSLADIADVWQRDDLAGKRLVVMP